jgi:ABC-2 type transport system ATP-binding protein
MHAIRTDSLTKHFDGAKAVDGLSLSVEEGEIYGLVGPDGAGKTTTMRMLAGVMDATSGQAWVAGKHTVRQAADVRDVMGYMSQRLGLYSDLTVMENLRFYADLYGVRRRDLEGRIERLMDFSGLGPFKRRLAGRLSGGMRQKLSLACALVHSPRVLLLDEPTNGVDPVSRRQFWRILYQLLREGVTILISTAYLDEAERCTRVGLLHAGRLIAQGVPREIKAAMPGAVIEVRGDDARAARLVLRQAMPRAAVSLFGDRVHVVCGREACETSTIKASLERAGAQVHSVEEIEPSLEDVFVSVLGGPHADKAPAAQEHAPNTPAAHEHAGDTPPSPAVSVRDLQKRFGDFVAVNRMSFEVAPGEIFGFLGPNGAGKSTTIRMLCGILTPSGGGGSVAGLDIVTQSEAIKSRIGYMSQRFSLYEDLTVEENLNFYGGIYRLGESDLRAGKDWVLEMAALKDRRRSRTGELSGGWKQRLALGCALLHAPRVVFLDEPTSGVDPISRRQFWDIIDTMSASGVTVFVTTHYMEEAEYCDRIGLVYAGELIALGSPGELKKAAMRQVVLEAPCENPVEAMGAIEGIEGVHEATLFGRGLHVMVDPSGDVSPRLRAALEAAGCGVGEIRRVSPALEDVFVSLIESHDRGAAG